MSAYAVRRLLQAIPTVLLASIVVFLVIRVLPGDPARLVLLGPEGTTKVSPSDLARVRRELGFDKPLVEQYLSWMKSIVTSSGATSFVNHNPIMPELRQRLPVTFELACLTLVFATGIGLPLGALAAAKKRSWVDGLVSGFVALCLGLPVFLSGALLYVVLIKGFKTSPPLGYKPIWESPLTNLKQFVWPAIALAIYYGAVVARVMRATLLDVLDSDFIRTAKAKGLRWRIVIQRHGVRAALPPVLALLGLQFVAALGGSVVAEALFNLPGTGQWLFRSVTLKDYPVVQLVLFVYAVIVVLMNIVVDLVVAAADPRIRFQ